MTATLAPYVIENWPLSKLENRYINQYFSFLIFPDQKKNLEILTEALSHRNIEERLTIFDDLKICYDASFLKGDWYEALVFDEMMDHYFKNILD